MRAQQKSMKVAAAAAVVLSMMLAGCSAETGTGEPSAPPSQSDSGSQSDAPVDGSTDSTARGADLATTAFAVSWDDAVDTAMGNFEGKLAELELDWNRDRYVYKIELVSDTEEYEVRIDADTGELVGEKTEKIESDDLAEKQAEIIDLDAIVSWDEALATALDAQNGTVNEWKLEGTEHGPQYEFDVDDDSGEDYEVTIDARTGELIGIDD